MSIEFHTTDYVASHGHEPRGRGSWAFFMNRKMDVMNKTTSFWTPGGTTYTEAKKLARAWVREKCGPQSSGTLYVGP